MAQAPGMGNVDRIKTPEGEGAFGFGFRLGPDFHRFVRSSHCVYTNVETSDAR